MLVKILENIDRSVINLKFGALIFGTLNFDIYDTNLSLYTG